MHRYEATISWTRGDQAFADNRYSRGHSWSFDGGVQVPASSSPHVVPEPMSVAANVDPEEALVAATSSCATCCSSSALPPDAGLLWTATSTGHLALWKKQ